MTHVLGAAALRQAPIEEDPAITEEDAGARTARRSGPARWPLVLLALPAGVATWSGWVGLGEMTGFGPVKPLPGILEDFTINTAITLPIGVETYAAYALGAWLSHSRRIRPGTRRFAKWSAIGSLVLGMVGQVAYHLLEVLRLESAPWGVTTVVSCLPVLVLGMGAALGHMLSADARTPHAPESEPVPESASGSASAPVSTPAAETAPVPDPAGQPTLLAPEARAVIEERPGQNRPPEHEQRAGGRAPDVATLCAAAVQVYEEMLLQGRVPSIRTIKTQMRLGNDKSKAVHEHLIALLQERPRVAAATTGSA